ncbi:hypothetical protein H671_2g5725 [Cricetulus griseus]|uniref:Uncharacterized protein n=1 Tax=Cricetulus griseus TaxID=10029 RepID=A0A061ILN1_CRIGR|nr:hypothetical protein H671_2g5725 [Cricetulus griseus]
MRVQCQGKPEEGAESYRAGVTGGCKLPCVGAENEVRSSTREEPQGSAPLTKPINFISLPISTSVGKLDVVAVEMSLTSERLFMKDESHESLAELSSCQRVSC